MTEFDSKKKLKEAKIDYTWYNQQIEQKLPLLYKFLGICYKLDVYGDDNLIKNECANPNVANSGVSMCWVIAPIVISFIGAGSSVWAAVISWKKERSVKKEIKENRFDKKLNDICCSLDELLDMCIEYWGVTNLKPDERNTKGHKITYNCKQISNILTRLSEKYKDFVNDYIVEFINDFNDIKNEATGGNFQSKLFQVDDEKIISLQNKIADFKDKVNSKMC